MQRGIDFLQALGIGVTFNTGDRVMAHCPLAPWTHSGGRDSNPSFGFRMTIYGNIRYKCFTCGEHGTLRQLMWKLSRLTGEFPSPELFEIAYRGEMFDREYKPDKKGETGESVLGKAMRSASLEYSPGGPVMGEARRAEASFALSSVIIDGGFERVKSNSVNMERIEKLEAADIPQYWFDRGYDDSTYRVWGMGHDERNKRLVFVCRNKDGDVVGTSGRLYWERNYCYACGRKRERNDKGKFKTKCQCGTWYTKYKHDHGKWRRTSLYGEHLHRGDAPIVLVEGSFDAVRLWTLGVRYPMAIFGSEPSPEQIAIVSKMTSDVLVLGDGDEAGKNMTIKTAEMLRIAGVTPERVFLIDSHPGKDPGDLTEAEAREVLPSRMFEAE